MALVRRARFWTRPLAAVLGLACFGAAVLEAQPRGNRLLPRFVTIAPPDQAEGERILAEFRQLGLPGDYFLGFDLKVLPRRGRGFSVPGEMWGTHTEAGPFSRLVLAPEAQPPRRLLVQNGAEPQIWTWSPEGEAEVEPLPLTRLLEPLVGTQATAFDLQMPFVHWPEFVFEGVARVRGRTAHSFLLYPPEDFAAAYPELGGVRIYLDMQFRALMQAVVLDIDEQPVRTLTVLDLKKVEDQWIVKSIDIREEETRNKTRFQVNRAALDVNLPAAWFTAEALTWVLEPPGKVTRID